MRLISEKRDFTGTCIYLNYFLCLFVSNCLVKIVFASTGLCMQTCFFFIRYLDVIIIIRHVSLSLKSYAMHEENMNWDTSILCSEDTGKTLKQPSRSNIKNEIKSTMRVLKLYWKIIIMLVFYQKHFIPFYHAWFLEAIFQHCYRKRRQNGISLSRVKLLMANFNALHKKENIS